MHWSDNLKKEHIADKTFAMETFNKLQGGSPNVESEFVSELRKILGSQQVDNEDIDNYADFERFKRGVELESNQESHRLLPKPEGIPANVAAIHNVNSINQTPYQEMPHLLYYDQTDVGNMERVISVLGEDLRYIIAYKKFIRWKEGYWPELGEHELKKEIIAIMVAYRNEALKSDSDITKAFSRVSCSPGAAKRVLELMKSELGLASSDIPPKTYYINTKSGVVDTKSGQQYPHEQFKEHYFTYMIDAIYDPSAYSPLWMNTLNEIFNYNSENLLYTQKFRRGTLRHLYTYILLF